MRDVSVGYHIGTNISGHIKLPSWLQVAMLFFLWMMIVNFIVFLSYTALLSEEVGKVPQIVRYFTEPPVDHWDRATLVTVSDYG